MRCGVRPAPRILAPGLIRIISRFGFQIRLSRLVPGSLAQGRESLASIDAAAQNRKKSDPEFLVLG